MNKAAVFVAVCCCVVLLFDGCDMFRKMAGRPTSEEIEAKREALLLKAEEKKDSALQAEELRERVVADSLVGTRQLSEEAAKTLEYRYYVVIGAFSKRDNAVKFSERAESEGYKPTLIAYGNGFTAVGICPSDELSEAYSALLKVREGTLSPEAWILDNGAKDK